MHCNLLSIIILLVGLMLSKVHSYFRSGEVPLKVFARSTTVMSAGAVDTIYALSSGGNTKSGVAVVRISGPSSLKCLEKLSSAKSPFVPPKPRMATLRSLYTPNTQDLLDKALVLWFPRPTSFTGEDVIELHVHGSKAVLSGLFQAFSHIDSQPHESVRLRPAERGEFTRRAFENGKMDLTEVEGLADLLAADTSVQRRQALRQMQGHLRIAYENWREVLLKCLAHTEAVIDFGDDDREGDINDSAMDELMPNIVRLKKELEFHLQEGRKGEIVRDGIQIVLCGPPNAGKSSLMNALARRPAAIVSPIAGTTRDVVEVRLDIGGYACIVRDTAGLRAQSKDVIEVEGMKRAFDAFQQAQIKILVADLSTAQSQKETTESLENLLKLNDKEGEGAEEDEEGEDRQDSQYLLVVNKKDITFIKEQELIGVSSSLLSTELMKRIGGGVPVPPYFISCVTGEGLEQLETGILASLKSFVHRTSDSPEKSGTVQEENVFITRERHRRHVTQCVEHLDRFLSLRLPMDLAAEEIRLAMTELGKVTGRVDVEELLDIIFRDFCIGK